MTRCVLDRATSRGAATRCVTAYGPRGQRTSGSAFCRVPEPFGRSVSAPGWTLRLRGRAR